MLSIPPAPGTPDLTCPCPLLPPPVRAAVRFTLPDDLAGGDGDAPGSGGAAGKPGKRKRGAAGSAGEEPSKKRGRKKGGDAAAAKDAAAAAGGSAAGLLEGEDGDGPVLWRVNYDEFNRRWVGFSEGRWGAV